MTDAQCRTFATARTVWFELPGDWAPSERSQMSDIWQKAGFSVVPNREQADLIIQVSEKTRRTERARHGFTQYNKPATAIEVTVRESGFIVLTCGQTVYRRDFASVTHNPDFWDSFTNLGPYTSTGESRFKVMASLAESIRRAR